MLTTEPLLRTPHGFKRFFSATAPSGKTELAVRGLGIRELMPPCIVDRPNGTDDYLLMVFHDRALAGTSATDHVTVTPDTMMIWPPGEGQYYGSRNERFSHSWIHVSGTRVKPMLQASSLRVCEPFVLVEVTRFLQCLTDVHGEVTFHVKPDYRIIGNLLENYLLEAARQLAKSSSEHWVAEPLLAVMRKIETSFDHAIQLSDLAEAAGMSISTLSVHFKKTFGLSPKNYLIQYRMRYAAHLMMDRNLNVSEVAAQVGYDDPFHFSKLFKKHCGASPRALRKKLHLPEQA